MFFGTIFIVGLLLVGLVLAGVLIGIFNKLVTYANRYKNAFAQIDVQLKRRYDLIRRPRRREPRRNGQGLHGART